MFSILKNTSKKMSVFEKSKITTLLFTTAILYLLTVTSNVYGTGNISININKLTSLIPIENPVVPKESQQLNKVFETNDFNIPYDNFYKILIEEKEERTKQKLGLKLTLTLSVWLKTYYCSNINKPNTNTKETIKVSIPNYIKYCSLKYYS